MNGSLEFLAKLNNERERLSRLAHLIARKQEVLRAAATKVRLGVDPDAVSLDIIRCVRAELAELETVDLMESDQ